ncbi:MAG: hypothetical protein NTX25_02895 [Proteobacteria bacterium]|nr:hypothetical protein [Pseudomonadota bacterium]
MSFFKKYSVLIASFFLILSSHAKAQSDEEFNSWSEAVGQGFDVKNDIDDFLRILGDDGSASQGPIDDSQWLNGNDGQNENDDRLLRLLQDISRKQVKALEYSQKAVESYYADYFSAKINKHKACMISGLAHMKAKKGLRISKDDQSLPNQFDFIKRFETIIKKLSRFRELLQCH